MMSSFLISLFGDFSRLKKCLTDFEMVFDREGLLELSRISKFLSLPDLELKCLLRFSNAFGSGFGRSSVSLLRGGATK